MSGAMTVHLTWDRHPSAILEQIERLRDHLGDFLAAVGAARAPEIQADAQANASWTDRSGNARQGLACIARVNGDTLELILYHSMSYGIWLEIARGGPFKIIMPTIYKWLPIVLGDVRLFWQGL